MALLQNDKAIFYHPLDDAVETLKTKTWTGSTSFTAAKISSGLESAGPTGLSSYAAAVSFDNKSQSGGGITRLSSTKVVAAYSDELASLNGKARVGTVSGTDITWAAEATFFGAGNGGGNGLDIRRLTDTKVVIIFTDSVVGDGRGVIGTVSGTDITFGALASYQTTSASGTGIGLAVLSSTKFVVTWQAPGTTRVRLGTVSGTDITYGTDTEAGAATGEDGSIGDLSSTTFVVAWQRSSASRIGEARVGTISGTDLTLGTTATFQVADANDPAIAGLSATKCVVVCRDSGDGNKGKGYVGTVSGSDVTFGAAGLFDPVASVGAELMKIRPLDSTHAYLTWRDQDDTSRIKSQVGAVSGADITWGPEVDSAGAGSSFDIAEFDSTRVIVQYKGFSPFVVIQQVGSLAGGADISGLTADYDSVAGATKVAFAAWLKNPSA